MAETLPNTTNMDFNNTNEQVKAYNTLRTYEAICVLLQSTTSRRRVTLPRTRSGFIRDQANTTRCWCHRPRKRTRSYRQEYHTPPHVNTRQGSSIDSFRVSYKFDTDEKCNIGSRSRR